MQIQPETLKSVMELAGVTERSTQQFFSTKIPVVYSALQYDKGNDERDERPTSMSRFMFFPQYTVLLPR